ncbi:hypothetical protein [Rubrivivax gelatinosus]|nr:hypothetical protein [Rubrivivax gelatinosus]MBG6081890.1 hypothetical protein [Rubrivivax gelatinosus]
MTLATISAHAATQDLLRRPVMMGNGKGKLPYPRPRVADMAEAWQLSRSLETFELPVPPSADRSRVWRRFVSYGWPAPRLVPASSAGDGESAVAYDPFAWIEYWRRTQVEPAPGASTERMFSAAQRRFLNCETGWLSEGGVLYFASLDTTGPAYRVDKVGVLSSIRMVEWLVHDPEYVAELRTICGPVLAAFHGEQEARRRIDELLARAAGQAAAFGLPEPASPPLPAPAGPVADAKARIRLFQQNGLTGGLTNEAACRSDDAAEQGGGTLTGMLASLFHVASDTRIGMPETATTRRLSERSRAGSKAYFVEREITAWAPVTVDYDPDHGASGSSCTRGIVTFVPEAGADYEAHRDSMDFCLVSVDRILPDGSLRPVAVQVAAPRCPPQASK